MYFTVRIHEFMNLRRHKCVNPLGPADAGRAYACMYVHVERSPCFSDLTHFVGSYSPTVTVAKGESGNR
jgi:hypothetical protein